MPLPSDRSFPGVPTQTRAPLTTASFPEADHTASVADWTNVASLSPSMPSATRAPPTANVTTFPVGMTAGFRATGFSNSGSTANPNGQFWQLPSDPIIRTAGPAKTIERPSGENRGRTGWPQTWTFVQIRCCRAP